MLRLVNRNLHSFPLLDPALALASIAGVEAAARKWPDRIHGTAIIDQQRAGKTRGRPTILAQPFSLLVALNDLIPDCLEFLWREMLLQVIGDAKDFGDRGPHELMTTPGATFLACERRRWRIVLDNFLDRLVGQASSVFGDFNHLKGSALGLEGGGGFQPLDAAGIELQTIGDGRGLRAALLLFVIQHACALRLGRTQCQHQCSRDFNFLKTGALTRPARLTVCPA